MRANLASDIQLPPGQWQTIFTMNLDPGVWDLLFTPEVSVGVAGGQDFTIEGRLWDGESVFWGSGSVPVASSFPAGVGTTWALHGAIAGGADLSLATVPTNLFAQLLYSQGSQPANAFCLSRTALNHVFASTWLFAQPDQGSGSLGATDHQLLLDLHQALAGQSFVSVAQHTGLTGSGTINVTWPDVAIRVSVTSVPPQTPIDVGSPNYYFDLGFVTVSNANGFVKSQRLVFLTQTYTLPAGAGQVGFTLRPGVSIDIVVLQALT